MKILVKEFCFCLICFMSLWACSNKQAIQLKGYTQGTYYTLAYFDDENRNFQVQLDSILTLIDETASTYNANSILSKINKNDTSVQLNEDFCNLISLSQTISEQTNGYFDITIAPLINLWNFDKMDSLQISPSQVDSVKQFVGWNKIKLINNHLYKENENIQLNMNAIAQGYTVQKFANFLKDNGVVNFVLDVGGEVFVSGDKNGQPWLVGIEKPENSSLENRSVEVILAPKNQSVVTSGSYRKYKIVDGQRYSHIIDKESGFPTRDSLLSVTVLHDDATFADAYATALMAMGYEKAIAFAHQNPDMGFFFIYLSHEGLKSLATDKMKQIIIE